MMKTQTAPWRGRGAGTLIRVFASLDFSTTPAASQRSHLDVIATPPADPYIEAAERRYRRAKIVLERMRAEQAFAAKEAARHAFASANGWKYGGTEFALGALARGLVHGGNDRWNSGGGWSGAAPGNWDWYTTLDHAEYYRESSRPYRAAAIVAHLYTAPDDGAPERMAAHYGLTVHRPPVIFASWYFPGGTHLVCYTRPGVSVRWLPGQDDLKWWVRR